MSYRFCDQEDPCTLMKKAASTLLSSDYSGQGFEVVVVGRVKKPQRVFFEYCPFCGTRIDPKFLATLKPRA